jgi:DNA-binding MarR family transcriptional regulator
VTDRPEQPAFALAAALYRTTNSFVREMDARLERDAGLTFVQAITLLAVSRFDHPQPHLVAQALSQQSQTVTGVLDRLERSGHLTRQRDLVDRRAVRLTLTRQGHEAIDRLRPALAGALDAVLSTVDVALRRSLIAGLDCVDASVRRAAGGALA